MTTPKPMETRPSLAWLRQFLKDELAPYPGRGLLVARMLLASTIVMILTMTFKMPFGAYGAIYALVISREDRQSTVHAVNTIIVAFVVAAAGVLVGARLFAGNSMLRLLWVIGSLFLMFYGLSAMSNYTAAARFGYLIIISNPLWDQHIPSESKVTGTLWAVGTIGLASVITAAIEVAFASIRPGDDLLRSLCERLAAVEETLRCYAADARVEEDTVNKIMRLGMLGTSRLRRVLQRSGHTLHYGEQMGAAVALVGRLVDLAATLASLNVPISDADRSRIETLADNVAKIRDDWIGERIPKLARNSDVGDRAASIPLLREMERTVAMIPEVFTGSQSLGAFAPPPPGQPAPQTFLVPDAFTNPAHIKFALRGCLAASLCYIIYTALDWPELSTSITTCFLTALTTVGASRQKQLLRFAGAIAGGAIGMAAQVWILPRVDSIFGFTLLFLVVTAAAAWIITGGPRLSYCGVQLAVAFYLINLQEFKFQTSLAIARDRVAGILLGLFMMWLVFDQLWSAPAGVEMKTAFISMLRAFAKLVREPLSRNLQIAVEQSYALRETVNDGFNKVRAFADAIWFEFGPSRQKDLALRSQILGWQPQLRVLFISCVALLKYRLQIPGFELPDPVRPAQREFEECLARTLDGMADSLQGNAPEQTRSLEAAFARLNDVVRNSGSTEAQGALIANLATFLPLCQRITGLAVSLGKEI